MLKTIPQGAATTVYAAVSPDLTGKSGAPCCDVMYIHAGGAKSGSRYIHAYCCVACAVTLTSLRSRAVREGLRVWRLIDACVSLAGAYLVDCKITEPSKIVSDREAIEKLWKITKEQIAAKQASM